MLFSLDPAVAPVGANGGSDIVVGGQGWSDGISLQDVVGDHTQGDWTLVLFGGATIESQGADTMSDWNDFPASNAVAPSSPTSVIRVPADWAAEKMTAREGWVEVALGTLVSLSAAPAAASTPPEVTKSPL